MRTKKACFVATSFVGGVATCFRPIIKQYLSNDYEIDLYLYNQSDNNMLYEIEDKINLYYLERPLLIVRCWNIICSGFVIDLIKKVFYKSEKYSKSAQRYNIELMEKMSSIPKKYDIAIAMHEFFPTYFVAKKIHATYKMAWEHPKFDVFDVDFGKESTFYECFDSIINVSQGCNDIFCHIFPQYKKKSRVLVNTIEDDRIKAMAEESIEDDFVSDVYTIVSVSRIDNSSKRIDRIIKIAKLLKERDLRFRWIIIGDGDEKKHIEKDIKDEGLLDYVFLLGFKKNPYPYVKCANLFVLTSQYEGDPIVIREALVLQKDVIATKCTLFSTDISNSIQQIENDDNHLSDFAEAIINHYNKIKI